MSDNQITRLADKVRLEGMEWGDKVAQDYHGVAASHMNAQWASIVAPILGRHDIDLTRTMDFACGFGRNALKLRQAGADHITLVDVNPDNIAYCREHIMPVGKVDLVQNNGLDLSELKNSTFTHIYTFDAMVHFDIEIVLAYIGEFARILKPGGTASFIIPTSLAAQAEISARTRIGAISCRHQFSST